VDHEEEHDVYDLPELVHHPRARACRKRLEISSSVHVSSTTTKGERLDETSYYSRHAHRECQYPRYGHADPRHGTEKSA
jgi:hypothetical protein